MIFKYGVGDTVNKNHSKIDGCCGSSLLNSFDIKSCGIYTDNNGRKIPLYELDCTEFFREDQLILVKRKAREDSSKVSEKI